ncbi:hypothetical protein GE061_019687 [Apolygus lucorum]|uniref:Nucleolar protein 10 n=1 Tax=Apolygus lucorum TaxID=248454 RepID=A0A6A4JL07_APOLU|nr:hypothetical protein GE061_019687 [Apolygus lucorum]
MLDPCFHRFVKFLFIPQFASKMYLHFYLDENKKRVYTFKKVDPNGCPTIPAHPARYSVGNEMSKERILIKRRFNILPTQGPPPVY